MLLALAVGASQGLAMFLLRNVWGYAYSNDEQVAGYIARMMPILAISIVFDSLQCVLSGVVRGCGQQKTGAFVNLVAYYIVGVPAAFFFAFICHLGGMGLWFGIGCGLMVQMLLLLTISLCGTNWDKEALKAKDRVFTSSLRADMTNDMTS